MATHNHSLGTPWSSAHLEGALPHARAGQFRLTRSKSSALLVWFDPGSPAFAIETLNAPNFDPSLALTSAPDLGLFANKPAEGFIGGIPGAGRHCVGSARVCVVLA